MTVAHGGENVFHLATENGLTRSTTTADAPDPAASGPGHAEPAAMQELRGLVDRARRGDEAAMPRLRTIFDEQPEVATWLGDLAKHSQEALLRMACGSDLGMAEAIRRSVAALRLELTGPSPPAIERLLAERVVATWLFLYWSEATAAQAMGVATNTRPQIAFCVERMDRAQRRHLAALGALATAQRLLPAAKAPSGAAVSEKAVAASGDAAGGKTIEVGGDDHVGPDENAHEPESVPMFAGLAGVAVPAVEATEHHGFRKRAVI
jgi:hypothetical protein